MTMLCGQWRVTPGQDPGWQHVDMAEMTMGTPEHWSVSVQGVSLSALIGPLTSLDATLFPVCVKKIVKL